jgi:hypothetical protein
MSSIDHLTAFIDKISKKEPFAVIRPADGEYLIMIDSHFTNCDNWTFNGGSLRHDLISVKNYNTLDNFFIGIPCKDCQGEDMVEYYKKTFNLNYKNTTYANIFCNKNWKPFTSFLIDTKHPFYYIGPGKNKVEELNVLERFIIDPFLVNNWDLQKDTFKKDIIEWVKDKNGTFLFSAGPISKVIIPLLYQIFPNNQYLDVGSSLDIFMKGNSNRCYINQNETFSNVICHFEKGHI